MKISLSPYRRVLLTCAVSAAALLGGMLLPAAASAQPADTPVTPTITLALSPATVEYGHQNVTVSGTVTTSAGPVAGATVTVSYLDADGQSAQISLASGKNGSYSGTILDPEMAAQEVTASVATSSTVAASASAQLGFTTDAVTITASFAQPAVNAGSTDTLAGVASYVSGGSPHPLANTVLSITSPGNLVIAPVSATVATGADGSFSYVTPEIGTAEPSLDFTVSSAATPYLEAGQLTITLRINQAAEINNFTGAISADRVMRFYACGGISEPLADGYLEGPLDFQYSRTRHGPWKTLGTGKTVADGQCFGEIYGGTYRGTFKAPLAGVYYRAYAPAVPGQTSAVSQVIHLQRYRTRITRFSITPRRVSAGGKVTVSGRLWHQTGKWTPDARQRIVIEFLYKNKTYTLRRRLVTDSTGRFRGIFAVPHTAAWLALYKGVWNEFATASKALTIRVE